MLWAPSDNNQEHHSNLKLMKPGDVFFGYYNTSIQFIGLVTSDPIMNQTNPYINDLSGIDESTSTWATDSERMGTIVNFEIHPTRKLTFNATYQILKEKKYIKNSKDDYHDSDESKNM